MYQRISLRPVVEKHWESTVYSVDRTGTRHFLRFDFAIFYAIPVLVAVLAASYRDGYPEVCDFILKFSILLMPLMLNLFFHVLRLIQEAKRGKTQPETASREEELTLTSMTQLAYHILYSACACFVCAVLAGVASFKLFWRWVHSSLPTFVADWSQFIGAVIVYAIAVHVFLIGLQILRKTYNIVSHIVD